MVINKITTKTTTITTIFMNFAATAKCIRLIIIIIIIDIIHKFIYIVSDNTLIMMSDCNSVVRICPILYISAGIITTKRPKNQRNPSKNKLNCQCFALSHLRSSQHINIASSICPLALFGFLCLGAISLVFVLVFDF